MVIILWAMIIFMLFKTINTLYKNSNNQVDLSYSDYKQYLMDSLLMHQNTSAIFSGSTLHEVILQGAYLMRQDKGDKG